MLKICLLLAVCFLGVSILASAFLLIFRNKIPEFIDSAKIFVVGVVASATTLFFPIYYKIFEAAEARPVLTILISVHNTIRLFVVDGDFEFITENLKGLEDVGDVYTAYCVLFAILFVAAPALTFGFVLSFFKNVSAYAGYFFGLKSKVYIFSELNDNSLALARSIKEKHKRKAMIVFTDVFETDDEKSYELIHHAKALRAICFKKDITTIRFAAKLLFNANLYFFIMGEDRNENISQALKLGKKYKYKKRTNMYVFSTQAESEVLTSIVSPKNDGERETQIKLRRVDSVYSLITRTLYETGYEKIFKSAVPDEDGIKWINVLVVGMGEHGTEMAKTLAWFCQMDGYRLRLNAFDIDKKAESRFIALCPELMSDKYNNHFDIKGEAGYSIRIHPGTDVETDEFYDTICALPQTTYVFVALGDDERNVATAMKLRTAFLRKGWTPEIQTVVYNTEKKESLNGITNFKNQEYDIDFIGDIKSSYSERVIMSSDIEEKALARHMRWGDEKSFWLYDYNRKSSMASAIHREMKIKCGIPGIEKIPEERSEEERWPIRILEHNRWNAYMRSEGYVYAEKRNDLAKEHHFLVPFDDLPSKEQAKDDD